MTGEGHDLLQMFLNLLQPRIECNEADPAEVIVDDTFSVPGVGTVVAGTVYAGVVRPQDTLMLGPDALGQYVPAVVKSIQRKRAPADVVHAGETATFALKKIKRAAIRKGMVMVAAAAKPAAVSEFEAEIVVLHHPTTIMTNYQAMVHFHSTRQIAAIVGMSNDRIRTGDKTVARFRFLKSPEYLKPGQRIVLREGRTKMVGTVTQVT